MAERKKGIGSPSSHRFPFYTLYFSALFAICNGNKQIFSCQPWCRTLLLALSLSLHPDEPYPSLDKLTVITFYVNRVFFCSRFFRSLCTGETIDDVTKHKQNEKNSTQTHIHLNDVKLKDNQFDLFFLSFFIPFLRHLSDKTNGKCQTSKRRADRRNARKDGRRIDVIGVDDNKKLVQNGLQRRPFFCFPFFSLFYSKKRRDANFDV